MARVRQLYTYKCSKGHVMKREFPLGTRIDDQDETTCVECYDKDHKKVPAYVVFMEFTQASR